MSCQDRDERSQRSPRGRVTPGVRAWRPGCTARNDQMCECGGMAHVIGGREGRKRGNPRPCTRARSVPHSKAEEGEALILLFCSSQGESREAANHGPPASPLLIGRGHSLALEHGVGVAGTPLCARRKTSVTDCPEACKLGQFLPSFWACFLGFGFGF